jgi:hypothetical protein
MSELTADQEQAVVAFDHAAEELRFFKSQQWSVANYSLLAQAALVTAPALIPHDGGTSARILSAMVSFVVASAAIWLLHSLDLGIDKERRRMEAAHQLLPALWKIHEPSHATARADATVTLCIAALVGAAVAIAIDLANA